MSPAACRLRLSGSVRGGNRCRPTFIRRYVADKCFESIPWREVATRLRTMPSPAAPGTPSAAVAGAATPTAPETRWHPASREGVKRGEFLRWIRRSHPGSSLSSQATVIGRQRRGREGNTGAKPNMTPGAQSVEGKQKELRFTVLKFCGWCCVSHFLARTRCLHVPLLLRRRRGG